MELARQYAETVGDLVTPKNLDWDDLGILKEITGKGGQWTEEKKESVRISDLKMIHYYKRQGTLLVKMSLYPSIL